MNIHIILIVTVRSEIEAVGGWNSQGGWKNSEKLISRGDGIAGAIFKGFFGGAKRYFQ